MEKHSDVDKIMPHYEQQSLCTTWIPYKQVKKFTAVKVNSVVKESNHLLIFGVPALNLRQETKALFSKFGKLLRFSMSKDHACERLTETYHAQYDKIRSARGAKRMLDIKNFYGGILHVVYAPELESITEARGKLIQRQRYILFKLRNLNNKFTEIPTPVPSSSSNPTVKDRVKLYMGQVNTICIGKQQNCIRKKRKLSLIKEFKPCFIDDRSISTQGCKMLKEDGKEANNGTISNLPIKYNNIKDNTDSNQVKDTDIADCTSSKVVTNGNERRNYNKFGNEIKRKVPRKPPKKIMFHINKKNEI